MKSPEPSPAPPSVTLPKGTTIRGIGDDATLAFLAKGLRLSADNTVENLTVTTTDYEVAIYNDTSIANAGTLRRVNVRTIGQIYLVAEDELDTVRVEVDGVHVQQADVRGRVEQPHGYNVDVLQGGLTLWNRQKDAASSFSATLKELAAALVCRSACSTRMVASPRPPKASGTSVWK